MPCQVTRRSERDKAAAQRPVPMEYYTAGGYGSDAAAYPYNEKPPLNMYGKIDGYIDPPVNSTTQTGPRRIIGGSPHTMSNPYMSPYNGGADQLNMDMADRRAMILNNAYINSYTAEQILEDERPKSPPAELTLQPVIGDSGMATSTVMASPINSSCSLHHYTLKIPATVDDDTGEDVPDGEIDIVPYQSDTEGCVPPIYYMEPIMPPVASEDGCTSDEYPESTDRMRGYDSPQARVSLSDRPPSVLCAVTWLLANGYGQGTDIEEWKTKLGAPNIDQYEAQYITQAAIWIAEGVVPEDSAFEPCNDKFSGDPALTEQNKATRTLVNMARSYARDHQCERNTGDPITGVSTPRGGKYYNDQTGSIGRMVPTEHSGVATPRYTRVPSSVSQLNTCSADGTQVCAKFLDETDGNEAYSHLIPGRDITVRIVCGRLLVGPFKSCSSVAKVVAACGCMNGFSYTFTDYCGNPLRHKECIDTRPNGTNGGGGDPFTCPNDAYHMVCMRCNSNLEGENAAGIRNRNEFYIAFRITQKYLCFQICSECETTRSVVWFLENAADGRRIGMRLSDECNYWQQIIETTCTCVCVELPIDEPETEQVHLDYPPIIYPQTKAPVIVEGGSTPMIAPDPIVFLSPPPPDPEDPPIFPPPVLLPPPQRPAQPRPTIFAPPIVMPQKKPTKPDPIPPPPRPILEAPRPPAPVLPPLPTPPPVVITPVRTVQRPVILPPQPPIPASAVGARPAAIGCTAPPCQSEPLCPPRCNLDAMVPLQSVMSAQQIQQMLNPQPPARRSGGLGDFVKPGMQGVGVIPPFHEGECGIACGETPVLPIYPPSNGGMPRDTICLQPMPVGPGGPGGSAGAAGSGVPGAPGGVPQIQPTYYMASPNSSYPMGRPGLTCPTGPARR